MQTTNISWTGYESLRRKVIERDGHICRDCGDIVGEMVGPLPTAHVHHIVPKSSGGKDTPENLITLCRDCHNNRHDHHVLPDSEDTADRGHPLEENPNWKGGRVVSSNGYILIKRPDHPDSDTRGYVYEHRYIAEKKIERRIKTDEHVHHENGDKTDNNPENLEVLTPAEHRAKHRENDDLRDPGESNPTIECACGCGETLSKYDNNGRGREFIHGHNSKQQESPTQDAILNELDDEPVQRSKLIEAIDSTEKSVSSGLAALKKKDKVENPKVGIWTLPKHADRVETEPEKNPTIECACGCGETFSKYDDEGREREYISGHNAGSPVLDGVLNEVSSGPCRRKELASEIGVSRNSIDSALKRLRKRGKVVPANGWGEWKLSSQEQEEEINARE